MADRTGIEWTDSSWNPVTGCTKVSPGCDRCYAEGIAHRFAGTKAYPNGFEVTLRPERLDQPLRWRRPRRVFVNSMSDLFHQDVPDEYIARVWAVMALAPQHTFQVLTKRHARMRSLLNSTSFFESVAHHQGKLSDETDWPLPNVWLGVSTENQQWADTRIPALLDTPAAVRFISAEPLLGPIDLGFDLHPDWGLDWVIVGGESGPGARSMHPDWVRHLRNQCTASDVPFLFKQWGEWGPGGIPERFTRYDLFPDGTYVCRYGKKAAGRELDGRTWDQYPEVIVDA